MRSFRSFVTACFFLSLLVILVRPALADDSRGHGAIYVSPSSQRIGWARSLGSDGEADRLALAECRGGIFSNETMARYNENRAGQAAMANDALPPGTQVQDCSFVIKFDSESNHACAGFAFEPDGGYSKGSREPDEAGVRRDLARESYSQTFVVCNDEKPVQGGILGFFDKLAKALATPTPAPVRTPRPYVPTSAPFIAPIPPISVTGGVAPNAIRIRNTYEKGLNFTVMCPNEAQPHSYHIEPGLAQTIGAADWNQSCSQFTIAISTPANDGSKTEVQHLINGGAVYELFYDADRGQYDVHVARVPMTVVNGTTHSVIYRVVCPDRPETSITIASGATNTSGLPCAAGEIAILTVADNGDRTDKRYPVTDGRTYTIQVDERRGYLILVPR
jgi:hypothetical protein